IYFVLMLLHLMNEWDLEGTEVTINQKFLESGHTHMEADTIHAAIEKVKKNTTAQIELPRDWANLIRMVYRKSPIEVIELPQSEFFNFKDLITTHFVRHFVTQQGRSFIGYQQKGLNFNPSLAERFFIRTPLATIKILKQWIYN